MGTTALITGANGFLGAWLAKALLARGDEVRCLVRPGSDASALAGLAVKMVPGDVTRPDTLPAAVDGAALVFHLAGIRRSAVRQDFFDVNAEGTRLVCEAMVKAGARRLVLAGSLAAAGPSRPGQRKTEEEPLAPTEWYGESKAEAERIAFSYGGRLEVTSCRPSRIVGPGDHENLQFFKLVKRGVILKLLGPERRLSMVDVEDCVAQLLLQAERPEAVGQAFFNSSEETTTVEALMRQAAVELGVEARVVPVPELALRGLAAAADVVTKATGRRLPLNRKLARQLLAPGWECSIEKAQRLLGYRPARTLADSIARSAKSYLELGWL